MSRRSTMASIAMTRQVIQPILALRVCPRQNKKRAWDVESFQPSLVQTISDTAQHLEPCTTNSHLLLLPSSLLQIPDFDGQIQALIMNASKKTKMTDF